jgi:uncharacterized protein (TIGR02118 family)
MIRLSVMYGNDGGKFDLDYYMNKHIPMARKLMEPFGLVSVEVDKGIGSAAPGVPAPFVVVAHMVFDSLEEMQKGLQIHDPKMAADVPNYTDTMPQIQISEILEG